MTTHSMTLRWMIRGKSITQNDLCLLTRDRQQDSFLTPENSLKGFSSETNSCFVFRVKTINWVFGSRQFFFWISVCSLSRRARLRSSGWLGEGSSIPELDDLEMESDPTLPSTEDVIRKTEQITKNIQELLRAAQENKHDRSESEEKSSFFISLGSVFELSFPFFHFKL